MRNPFLSGQANNIATRSLSHVPTESHNRSTCCGCNGILNGSVIDKRLLPFCQEWMKNKNQLQARKATIIDEVSLEFLLKISYKRRLF